MKFTDLPWKIYIPLEYRLTQVKSDEYFHPLFLYESLWSVFTFGILMMVFRYKRTKLQPGSYFSIYLILYGLGRFFLEFLRIESWRVTGINVAQLISSLLIVFGLSFLFKKNYHRFSNDTI